MKVYDFNKAKELILANKALILSASLGMHEDWFWTAETVFEDGEFTRELMTNEDAEAMNHEYMTKRRAGMSVLSDEANGFDGCKIAGIYGSDWATPTLLLKFANGEDQMLSCYVGESNGEMPANLLGVLSQPVQNNITPLANIDN